VALTDPLGGQWQWAYSETGLLVRRADPAGQATALIHDAAGNLLEVRTVDGQQRR
jgi:YD repeat-containing protein